VGAAHLTVRFHDLARGGTLCDVREFLTPTAAARELHVSRATAYRMVKDEQIESIRIRGSILIPLDAVEVIRAQSRRS
jgi:excisionase family DNA binding protein